MLFFDTNRQSSQVHICKKARYFLPPSLSVYRLTYIDTYRQLRARVGEKYRIKLFVSGMCTVNKKAGISCLLARFLAK